MRNIFFPHYLSGEPIELQNLVFYKNVKDMYIYITLN